MVECMNLEVDRDQVKTGRANRQAVARVIDREAGVVCYLFGDKEGVAAVPLSETNIA